MKNEDKWFENYEAVKAHVALSGHFPDKHSIGNNWYRYQRKCSRNLCRIVRFVDLFPGEVLCAPFWKMWHWWWRKRQFKDCK